MDNIYILKNDSFNYVHSCDIKANLSIKIGSLEGKRPKPTYKELLEDPVLQYSGRNQDCSDLVVECVVYGNGRCFSSPIETSYKAFSTRWNWNEWLEFPIRFCDLPRDATLIITVFDYQSPRTRVVVGGTCIALFGKTGVMPRGLHDLRIWPEKAADIVNTPGEGPLDNDQNDRMFRLNRLVKKHESGQMARVDWLDRLVFREIEVINDKEKRSSNFMYLMIEFPKVEVKGKYFYMVWWEDAVEPETNTLNKYYKGMSLYDPELGLENLHESKHHHLARSLQSGVADREMKPSPVNRDRLYSIVQYPPTRQLTSDEQDLIWKYRFFLHNLKKGLPKFLRCVNWNFEKEAEKALSLMHEWSPPDPQDALELLGPDFTHPEIRKYAVERLNSADDEELLLYLMQLVQALRYEAWQVQELNILDVSHYSLDSDSSLGTDNFSVEATTFQSDNGAKNFEIDSIKAETSSIKEFKLHDKPGFQSSIQKHVSIDDPHSDFFSGPCLNKCQDLASFLIWRSCQNSILANYLYWYLLTECEEKAADHGMKQESKVQEMYLGVMSTFKLSLQKHSPKSKATWHMLQRQQQFVNTLVNIMETVAKETSGRLKKIEKLQTLLADPQLGLSRFEALPLPLNPEVKVVGVIAEKATLFKSNLEPCRLTFRTVDATEYITIFKCGDDLRQDQLIIQIISLMDKLLLNENMDLKLTPYKVLATSSKHGFVQYIDAISVAEVLSNDGSIDSFLRAHAPCESAPCGISPPAMDCYVRSLAGYCIITYLLGVGDRHLDNILMTRTGRLFHIDFGYILGRDPKPLPPPMKLTREMIETMGGAGSDIHSEFLNCCYTTFVQLRRHSAIVLHLFSLMVDANVPDIALEPDKTVLKLEERFCLALSEEAAVAHVKALIDASAGAVVAIVVEQIHRLAQYIRK